MPAIPEFVLRKLYVPASLQPAGDGFTFQMNNTFAPVTLLGFSIAADGAACPLDQIEIRLAGQPSVCAAQVTAGQPFALPVNEIVTINIRAGLPRKKLSIRVDTREAGPLAFSIPIKAGADGTGRSSPLTDLTRRVRNTLRAQRVRRDPDRPALHFAAPVNWMNDPNGLIYWQGLYHLYYQHNPYEPVWGNMHWGHAVSTDMLHWQHRPLALFPDPAGADAGGCYSGCAVEQNGQAALLYTAVYPETQCLAVAKSDDLNEWTKLPVPVIPAPPAGLQLEGFRDPCVWREGNEWRMALGSGIKDVGGAVLLYRSTDLQAWEYVGILCQGNCNETEPIQTGIMWECPSFFPLGEKWVLILSIFTRAGDAYTIFFTGNYQHNHFIPDGPACLLDDGAGGCLYAPQTFIDADGWRVLIGWLREARPVADQQKAGWSGAMSLPRVLSLNRQGRLIQSPHPKVLAAVDAAERVEVPVGQAHPLGRGCTVITVRIPSDAGDWSGILFNDGAVKVGYQSANRTLEVDCTGAGGLRSTAALNHPQQLLIFVDGSTLEVFADDQTVLSARFYGLAGAVLRAVGGCQADIRVLK